MFSPRVRQAALTVHVAVSVGWLGSVVAFLALSVAGLTSDDAVMVRSAYVAMNVLGATAIVPLSVGALLTGVIQSLGTAWGLFRYYWVVMKLALTIVATFLLVLHQFTAVESAAVRVSQASPQDLPDLGGIGSPLVVDAAGAMLLLLAVTTLSVFKPWGKTAYGHRIAIRESTTGLAPARVAMNPALRTVLVVLGALVALIVVMHLAGGGMRHV